MAAAGVALAGASRVSFVLGDVHAQAFLTRAGRFRRHWVSGQNPHLRVQKIFPRLDGPNFFHGRQLCRAHVEYRGVIWA